MLDAYIIDRIRRERERTHRESARLPLHIERPEPPGPSEQTTDEDVPERGSAIVDYRVDDED